MYSLWREDKPGTQSRKLEVGTEAENTEKSCLLTWFPWLTQLSFLDSPAYLPRVGLALSRLGHAITISNHECALQTYWMGAIP